MKDFSKLLSAWFSGTYRVFPWRTLFVLILVGAYAINPFDLIPDFIPVVGVIDDAAMLGFLVRSLMKDVQKFKEWEVAQTPHHAQPPSSASKPFPASPDITDAEFREIK